MQEAAGGGDGRDVEQHAGTDMHPTEGLPVAVERPAIFGATRVVGGPALGVVVIGAVAGDDEVGEAVAVVVAGGQVGGLQRQAGRALAMV